MTAKKMWGVWSKDIHTLHPDQWVNVYEVMIRSGHTFKCFCQVKDVPISQSRLFLQTVDERGNPVEPIDGLINNLWSEAQREFGE